jgi:hypothetical protein
MTELQKKILFEGELKKESETFKIWNSRYFILYIDCLVYKTNKDVNIL